jgi:hypothetical protein
VAHQLQTPHYTEDGGQQGKSSKPTLCIGTVPLLLANFSDEELTVSKATQLGIAQEVSESLLVSLDEGESDKVSKR